MKYTFECKHCHVIRLVDSKEDLAVAKAKHFTTDKAGRKVHVPFAHTLHIEMRTSRHRLLKNGKAKGGKPYAVLVANDD